MSAAEVMAFRLPRPLQHQADFWTDRTHKRELAMIGGQGTGKTLALAFKLALLSAENAPCPTALVVPSFTMFDKIHRREWPMLFADHGLEGVAITGFPNVTISWPWGSFSFVYSAERPESIVGTNLAAAVGDEPAQWDREAYERITGRIRHPQAKVMQLALAGTPEGVPSWFADKFNIDDVVQSQTTGWSRRTIRAKGWHRSVADYRDRLRETYQNMPALFETYARGGFVPLTTGRCYPQFSRALHVRAIDYDPMLDLVLACDFNVHAMRWLVMQFGPNDVRVIDEIALGANSSVTDAARVFVERYSHRDGSVVRHHGHVVVMGDAAGKAKNAATATSCYSEMMAALREVWPETAMRVAEANPPQRHRVDTVNWNLAQNRLFIDPKCKELALDLEQVVWREGSSEIEKSKDSKRTHASDALGYALHMTRPIEAPQRPGVVFVGDGNEQPFAGGW